MKLTVRIRKYFYRYRTNSNEQKDIFKRRRNFTGYA